jgi:hypothetical protein
MKARHLIVMVAALLVAATATTSAVAVQNPGNGKSYQHSFTEHMTVIDASNGFSQITMTNNIYWNGTVGSPPTDCSDYSLYQPNYPVFWGYPDGSATSHCWIGTHNGVNWDVLQTSIRLTSAHFNAGQGSYIYCPNPPNDGSANDKPTTVAMNMKIRARGSTGELADYSFTAGGACGGFLFPYFWTNTYQPYG